MDSTIRKWVNELENDVNAVTPDARISKRYLFQKLMASVNYYIRQLTLVELLRASLNYSVVDCFEMEQVPSIQCCDFNIPNCKTVQRSLEEVPETYGSYISAYNLDDDAYKIITARKFKNIIQDDFYNSNDKYAWIENKHLIIPNSQVEIIKLGGYFMNPIKAKQSGCGSSDNDCYSPLDEPFNIPDKIKSIVMKDALQSLLTKVQIPKDETTNSNLNLK